MSVIEVAQRYRAIQYDGNNGSFITSIFGTTPVSDDGETLVFDPSGGGDNQSISKSDWVVFQHHRVNDSAQFHNFFHDNAFRSRFTSI